MRCARVADPHAHWVLQRDALGALISRGSKCSPNHLNPPAMVMLTLTLMQPVPRLQVLFHTDVKTDGACTILEALTSNSTLQKLDLGGNDLGPEVSFCF